jgi:hypothetical protein
MTNKEYKDKIYHGLIKPQIRVPIALLKKIVESYDWPSNTSSKCNVKEFALTTKGGNVLSVVFSEIIDHEGPRTVVNLEWNKGD